MAAEHAADDAHHEYHSHASMYVKIWAVLLVLLVISILGPMLENFYITLVTAFGIATIKASLVVKYFMHLDKEPKFIWYILITSIAFVLLFFFAAAPDVMNHEGATYDESGQYRWENTSAKQWIEKKMAEGDPADHHGAAAGDHGAAGEHEAKDPAGGH